MGFYAPAQIVRDAREHGVEVRPICVNASGWDCTLEAIDDERFAVRLGLRMVRGLANKDGAAVVAARGDTPFASVDDVWRRAKVPVSSLVELADADAMKESLGLARRQALWAIKALRDEPLELWTAAAEREARMVPELTEPEVAIRPMTAGGEVVEDYRHVGLSLRISRAEARSTFVLGRSDTAMALDIRSSRYRTIPASVAVSAACIAIHPLEYQEAVVRAPASPPVRFRVQEPPALLANRPDRHLHEYPHSRSRVEQVG
jgi:DNA polymerase III alpha subunit